MIKPTVTTINQNTVLTPNGRTTTSYTVHFNVGDQGPFSVQIAEPDFNSANVQKAMQAKADEIEKIIKG